MPLLNFEIFLFRVANLNVVGPMAVKAVDRVPRPSEQ